MALTSAKLYFKVTATTGTTTVRGHLDKGTDNWGTTVNASEADFSSTDTTQASSDITVNSTGWKSISFDTSNFTSVDTVWFRLSSTGEGVQETVTCTFASQNNATSADRPYLELTWSSGTTIRLLALTGVGQ